MNKMIKKMISFMMLSVIFVACSSDSSDDETDCPVCPEGETSMMTYAFEDADGNSTVSYPGQVVRNLLINDIKTAGANRLSMYNNDADNLTRAISAYSGSTVQEKFGDFTNPDGSQNTSNLSGKIAKSSDSFGVGDATVYGYDLEPDALMKAWFDAGNTLSYSPDGLDIGQMIQKGLMGVVSYYQGTSKYLGVLFDQDNSEASDATAGKYYTDMEHYWDESFGYFGASRDYLSRTDAEIKSSSAFDTNEDSQIDYTSEFCSGISVNAAKRDDGSSDFYDFTSTIMSAYIQGRHLISTDVAGENHAAIRVQRSIIVNNWEMLLAANSIHYINDTMEAIGDGTGWDTSWDASCTESDASGKCADYSKYFSEMRGFAMGLQYNTFKMISDSDLNMVYDYMRAAPEFPATAGLDGMLAYYNDLLAARDILEAAYGFNSDVVAGW
tara:strand:- start:23888 stop:25207 length:1320 start_codon:yes stop_codon:yes gene_type:complete